LAGEKRIISNIGLEEILLALNGFDYPSCTFIIVIRIIIIIIIITLSNCLECVPGLLVFIKGEYGWFRIERGTNCLLVESQCSWGVPKLSESNPLQVIKTERRRISRITIPSLDDY